VTPSFALPKRLTKSDHRVISPIVRSDDVYYLPVFTRVPLESGYNNVTATMTPLIVIDAVYNDITSRDDHDNTSAI